MIRRAHKPLTANARRLSDGEYVRLSDGVTHFRIEGPTDGAPLVLLHGATVPLWEFDFLVPLLDLAGFRTLRFDLFGHGLSDRPKTAYTLELFVRQTIELLDATGFPHPIAMLGHSVGAAIAAAVCAARPAPIERLVLVAPMLNFAATSAWSPLLRCPGLGELLMLLVARPLLVRRRRLRYAGIGQPQLTERFLEQASYEGFWRALLSMVRCEALGDQSLRYAALAELDREVLVISGARDRVLPTRDLARVRQLLSRHSHVEIAGAEHNLLLTHAVEVAAALRSSSNEKEVPARNQTPSGGGYEAVARKQASEPNSGCRQPAGVPE
jgi:pimeloyl-ACP methyl ester carboxylesterase